MWISEWGDEFETEEDARDDAREHMEWDDYKEEMQYLITWDKLWEFAKTHPSFTDQFEDELLTAEDNFFDENYHEIDEDD